MGFPVGRTNFTLCQVTWQPLLATNTTLRDLYGWQGAVHHIPKNPATQISTYGCKQLCGNGTAYYPWSQSSSTINTWILPIIGVLVQAPFVSNAFWATIFTIARWIGSPMASLAYLLWNIRVSGKAALMVDMCTDYRKFETNPKSNFGSVRDSFYLLTTMNQYSMNQTIGTKREAEGLLRIALFSKDLRLLKRHRKKPTTSSNEMQNFIFWNDPRPNGGRPSLDSITGLEERCEPVGHLDDIRQRLALQLRETRRRGVVPVFISVLWFLFSMAISIQSAFGYLGQNAMAHDLALGCLLSWIPVLILCSIVDRNPVSSDELKGKLNKLVDQVRAALEDPAVRQDYINSVADIDARTRMREWVTRISDACPGMREDFFTYFAGQGRTRWHYGVAHPILTDIEASYIKEEGRDWLHSEVEARNHLVLGKVEDGLDWFDYRELWQILAAIIIVVGCAFGAWMISYFTPTVGLGCRSGGYTVFVTVAFFLLSVEMVTWWVMDAEKQRLKKISDTARKFSVDVRRRMSSYTGRRPSQPETMEPTSTTGNTRLSLLPLARANVSTPEELAKAHHRIQENMMWWFFRPLEVLNTAYLCYLIMAQTLGADNTCECMTSTWAPGGGYLDFTQWNVANSAYVDHYWIGGTTISVSIMGVSMIYLILEWCLQSHLSTSDMESAAKGLRNTRRFRYGFYSMVFGAADAISTTSLRWHADIWCDKPHHEHSAKYRPPPVQVPKTPTVTTTVDEVDSGTLGAESERTGRSPTQSPLLHPQMAHMRDRSGSSHSPSSLRIATSTPSSTTEVIDYGDEEHSAGNEHLGPYWRRGHVRRPSNESDPARDVERGTSDR